MNKSEAKKRRRGEFKMGLLHVTTQGAVVRKRGMQVVVTKGREELEKKPIAHLDQVVLVGNVQLTTQAAALLLAHEVDVVFMTSFYGFRGRLMAQNSKFAELRHAQLVKMSDGQVKLEIARAVVVGKLTNQRTILMRQLQKARREQNRLSQAVNGIAQMIRQAQRASNLDSLRGFEGKAGAYYFGAWRLLMPKGFQFTGRAYYPAPDPVNALLSFGYGLLTKEVATAVQLVGLDPYLGFFHVISYGRPSLALDMMEEFRPILVDGMVLELLHQGQIKPSDFERTRNPKRPVQLKVGARDLVVRTYEKRLQSKVLHHVRRQHTTYRRCIELQVRIAYCVLRIPYFVFRNM
jgi:CRISPR-associated protein Cas1